MKAKSIAASVLTAAFLAGSTAVTYAQTNSPTGGTRTTTTTSGQGGTASTTTKTAQKKRVDCPGKSESSHGKAAQKNPNCVTR